MLSPHTAIGSVAGTAAPRHRFAIVVCFTVGLVLMLPSLTTLVAWTPVAPWASPALAAPGGSRDYPPVENVQVEMSDGIHLNTDVYYPQTGDEPWPVMLYRTPYNIAGDHIGWMAEHGFVAVCQDSRGRFGSEGLDRMFRDDGWGPDHQDGKETVDWILDQPWCNGRIGTYGGSARGITQNMLAGALPGSVRCMYIVVAAADLYEHAAFPGGAFRKRDIEGWLNGQGSPHMIDSMYVHPSYDEFWTWTNTRLRHPLESIPAYHVGGWYDLFSQGTLDAFTGLQYGGGPGAAGNQKLMIGPWSHGSMGGGATGELFYPDAGFAAAEALIGDLGEWVYYWMEDQPTGVMDLPPIAYYMMGDVDDPAAPGNEWRALEAWPPPGYPVEFFLHAGGELAPAPAPGPPTAVSYAYDPEDPVPTLGGGNLIGENGPYDQSPVLDRDDVLIYQTEPLASPLEVAGRVTVTLCASSDRLDTDFTAKLCDVYPDGRAMLVCDGILRARYRGGTDAPELMVPGEVYEMTIDLWSTAICFNEGHRILVALSSSNYPRFDNNPNTGDPFMQHQTTLVATNTIYHGESHPTALRMWALADAQSAGDRPWAGPGGGPLRITASPSPFCQGTTIRRTGAGAPAAGAVPGASDAVVGTSARDALQIFDPAGRWVRSLPVGDGAAYWDGRDHRDRQAPAGMYLVRWRSGRRIGETRILRVR